MSEIGNFFLLVTMFSSSLSIIVLLCHCKRLKGAWQSIKNRNKNFFTGLLCQNFQFFLTMMKNATILPFYLSIVSTILAFCTLIYAFIISDFSLQNVFLNSSTLKPLIYKIAGSWSSHEGSMLLWFSLLQIVSCCYIFLLKDKRNKSLYIPLILQDLENWNIKQGASTHNLYLIGRHANSLKFCRSNSSKQQSISIGILSVIQLLFSSFIYFTSNPFNVFSFTPKEGLGLNPMLQDIALSIHPPLLYLGYVSYAIPFTIVSAMLLSMSSFSSMSFLRKQESIKRLNFFGNDIRLIKIFSNIGILFTTIGIALGSWWAYRELGWGGFWFFDPVENISLFPWLSGIMLHHSIMITIKTGRMQNWTIILSIVTFLLVIFSTFLVRSGFITSIHSFAFSPERGIYLLAIFLIVALGSTLLYIAHSISFLRKQKSIKWLINEKLDSCFHRNDIYTADTSKVGNQISGEPAERIKIREHRRILKFDLPNFEVLKVYTIKEKAITLGNIFFLLSLIVLISATLYPLVYSLFDAKQIIIDEKFFINNFIIFIIPILFTIGFFTTKSSIKKHISILILSLIIIYLISFKVKFGIISALTMIASIFLMFHNLYYILVKTHYFKQPLKASAASMILGHFGFALIAFSITMNALLQSEMDFTGKVGTSNVFDEFKVTLQNIKFAQGKNYYRQIAEFWLEDNSQNITILKPENRLYIVEKDLSQESDIYSYLLYDLYAVLSNIDGDIIHAKIYYRPMMSFIWLGVIITVNGFLIGLINNKRITNARHRFNI